MGPRAILFSILALSAQPAFAEVREETLVSPVGTLHLVHPDDAPKGLVLFLPGAGGWDAQAAATAREAADQGHLVAGLPWSEPPAAGQAPVQTQAQCRDLGADLARLATWVGDRQTLPKGALPILLGESEGGALAYAGLLQSPPHRFHAVLTRGFCPRWPVALPPPCRTGALTDALVQGEHLLPAAAVPAAWYLFDAAAPANSATGPAAAPAAEPSGGATGGSAAGPGPAKAPAAATACPAEWLAPFAERVANARRVSEGPGGVAPPQPAPAGGGDDDLSPLASLLQWLDPTIPDQVAQVAAAGDVAGLPLIEVRAPHEDPKTFAVMVSGDGGWAAIDRGVTARLAARGISTVGLDSLSYFWKTRTPAETTRDLTRVLRHYLDAWHKERVILIGYSFGAEVLPFMANGLPPELRPRITLAAFLGLGRTAMFEFHLTDWLNAERGDKARPVLPQVKAMTWTHRLCVYGADEEESLCPELAPLGIRVQRMPGDHHFDEDYPGVADLILESAAVPPGSGSGN